jgi:hypothetical protein
VTEFSLFQAVCEILQYDAAFEKVGHGSPQRGCVVYPNPFSLRIFGRARLHARFATAATGALRRSVIARRIWVAPRRKVGFGYR